MRVELGLSPGWIESLVIERLDWSMDSSVYGRIAVLSSNSEAYLLLEGSCLTLLSF